MIDGFTDAARHRKRDGELHAGVVIRGIAREHSLIPFTIGLRTAIDIPAGESNYNSASNERNPHRPPQRVTFGPQSSDEMGEFWMRVPPVHAADGPALDGLGEIKKKEDCRCGGRAPRIDDFSVQIEQLLRRRLFRSRTSWRWNRAEAEREDERGSKSRY